MSDIRKKSNGRFQLRFADKAAKSGYAYKSFATRKEALAYQESLQAVRERGPRSREIHTVEQGLQKWLDVCEKEGRNGGVPVTNYTLKNYQWRRDLILEFGWEKDLQDLQSPDMVEFRSWLLKSYSRDVAAKLLSSFHSMILEMLKRGVLTQDILVGVSIRNGSRYDTPIVIPTEAEVRSLLSASDRLANSKNKQTLKTWERYRPMLYLAADSGMRPQEYIALPRANVGADGVQVDQALERGGQISVTKTPAGRRFIDLSTTTLDMVRFYMKKFSPETNPYDLVFPTSSGKWQTPENWRNRGFHAACEEAGLMVEDKDDGKLKPKYTPYDLRHFYASMLIEQRVNLKRIQKLMGHEKIETTLNVYGHIVERVEGQTERRAGLLASMGTDKPVKEATHVRKSAERSPAHI